MGFFTTRRGGLVLTEESSTSRQVNKWGGAGLMYTCFSVFSTVLFWSPSARKADKKLAKQPQTVCDLSSSKS